MTREQLMDRIVMDPKVMVGKPVIRGTRLTVDHILNLLGQGMSSEQILAEYRGVTNEDIQACLLFASESLRDTAFMPLTSSGA